MAKTTGKRKHSALIGGIVIAMAILSLLIYLTSVMTSTDLFFTESAQRNALINLQPDYLAAEQSVQVHYDNLYEIAGQLESSASKDTVVEVMSSYIGSEKFGNLHYYSQGTTYSVSGNPIERTENGEDLMRALAQSQVQGCTPIFTDVSGYDCIAFYVPVKGSAFVDGVLSIVQARNIVDLSTVLDGNDAALIVEPSGRVLTSFCDVKLLEYVGSDYYSFINRLTTDKTQINELGKLLLEGERSVCSVTTPRGEYVVCFAPIGAMNDHFLLVTLRYSQSMIDSEMVYIRHVIALVAIIVLALVGVMVYIFFFRRKMTGTIDRITNTDSTLGCPNQTQFLGHCAEALKDPQWNFAVCVLELRQYSLISERLQKLHTTELLKYLAKVLDTLCAPREAYCYLENGTFALLLSSGSENAIKDRVRLVEAMANKHAILSKSKSKKKFNVGVSRVSDSNRGSAEALLEQAHIACSRAKNNVDIPYEVFDAHTTEASLTHIESEMEDSLENGDFKLFLQPKYNVAADQLDSAEALVRWFDPKTGSYRFPGEFLGLFETNGFIKKLDHFMYAEALKLLSSAVQRGEKIVPISLNVSLLTANSPDFLDYYISTKNDYRIPDGYIVIEFTENIASSDTEQLRSIVSKLRSNGIRCSLDNFGTGYGSLSVLKNIPLDEIKMDRMFLKPGFDGAKDASVQQATTALAKTLGLQVVQMGVESKEMFDYAIAKGCDVIQGYYYAKAIPVDEYRLFIKSNTSIKYKSLVK